MRRVAANVSFGLEKTKLTKAERRERALKTLAGVGLREHGDRWPHQLSGSQRQRVALARALCVRPEILLMDEPFSALDAPTREALQDELVRIWQAQGITVLFVTHDVEKAVYLADRVIALGGKPGEVRSSVTIDIARPRRRGDPVSASLPDASRPTFPRKRPLARTGSSDPRRHANLQMLRCDARCQTPLFSSRDARPK